MSDEGMSDEMLAVVRKDISSSGDFGEVAAHVAAALITRLAAAERERDALRDALEAMIASRDANSVEREQYKEPCDGNEWHGYWSPHSSMIESRFVAAARAALTANHSAPVVEE